MQIVTFQKLTLLDFPEKTAAIVFTPSCNFRCGYCHNPELVNFKDSQNLIPEKDFFDFLEKRKNLLDGICLTGGEPTLQKDLPQFLKKIHQRGFLTKLDTNGSKPEILEKLLREGLLDYVAMDVKASPENYANVVGGDFAKAVETSRNLIMQSDVNYEFRTTLVKELVDEKEWQKILEFVRGAEKFFLQNFRVSGECLDKKFEKFHGFTTSELKKMCEEAGRVVKKCEVRA